MAHKRGVPKVTFLRVLDCLDHICQTCCRSENPHLLKSAALVNRARRGRVIEDLAKRVRALELEEEASTVETALEEVLTLTEIVPVTQSKPEVFMPKVAHTQESNNHFVRVAYR